ncbi:PREDICTED: uncharacterized protein LOC109298456 [Gavialis gangeticus]|uniref:uncharacterized protein LOC109298456 n=1 Tax=Gavialis gangeticus TaxID=94835 RepID=UPI00092E48CB|nr:PREDICTED: uncharacterized protein LOC109298456 [Gavialis gangeticus]
MQCLACVKLQICKQLPLGSLPPLSPVSLVFRFLFLSSFPLAPALGRGSEGWRGLNVLDPLRDSNQTPTTGGGRGTLACPARKDVLGEVYVHASEATARSWGPSSQIPHLQEPSFRALKTNENQLRTPPVPAATEFLVWYLKNVNLPVIPDQSCMILAILFFNRQLEMWICHTSNIESAQALLHAQERTAVQLHWGKMLSDHE